MLRARRGSIMTAREASQCSTRTLCAVAALLLVCVLGAVRGYPPPVPMYFPDCVAGPLAPFPICNPALPASQRVGDLLARMNITEKSTSSCVHRTVEQLSSCPPAHTSCIACLLLLPPQIHVDG